MPLCPASPGFLWLSFHVCGILQLDGCAVWKVCCFLIIYVRVIWGEVARGGLVREGGEN